MTPKDLRRAMRQRRKELRKTLPALRKRAREQAQRNPTVRKEQQRRQRRRTLLLALLLLLLCLIRCDCQPPPEPAQPAPKVDVEPKPEVKPKPPAPKPPKRTPIQAKTDARPRADYQGEARAAPSWLDDFRLQVAARSGRLSECFKGAEKPGALRWTTSVSPESGAVSQHELEPLGAGAEIQGEQRACVLQVLSNPAYKLGAAQKQALPNRLSLVIEF